MPESQTPPPLPGRRAFASRFHGLRDGHPPEPRRSTWGGVAEGRGPAGAQHC